MSIKNVWEHLPKRFHSQQVDFKEETNEVVLNYMRNLVFLDMTEGVINKVILQVSYFNSMDNGSVAIKDNNNLVIQNPQAYNEENVMFGILEFSKFIVDLEDHIHQTRKALDMIGLIAENNKRLKKYEKRTDVDENGKKTYFVDLSRRRNIEIKPSVQRIKREDLEQKALKEGDVDAKVTLTVIGTTRLIRRVVQTNTIKKNNNNKV